jgi:hypothetical protein
MKKHFEREKNMKIQTNSIKLSLALLLFAVFALTQAANAAQIWTDQEDYGPDEVVYITGTGFNINSVITVTIVGPEEWGADQFDSLNSPWWAYWSFTEPDRFDIGYLKVKCEGTFIVTATDGTNTATTTFTDATINNIYACGSVYPPAKSSFTTNENVYAYITITGGGSISNTVDIYVVSSPLSVGDITDVSGGYESVTVTDNTGPFVIWTNPTTPGNYYVVLDGNQNGKYASGEKIYAFTITENTAPTVTNVSPNSGHQGETLTSVIITGTNFTGTTGVSFGAGITVNSFTEDSSTQITANITIGGAASTGFRDVSVTTSEGTGTLTNGFNVTDPPADTTPPEPGTVNDGLAADIDYQTSLTTINANWSGFSDPESGIAGYEWAIGTTSGGTDIQGFTSVGITGTSATNSSLALTDGTTYYVTVRATNGVGLSTDVTSDGVFVDSTAPIAGTVNDGVAADIDYQASTDTINANWSGFSDPESGISGYEWAIGTTSGGTEVQGFTSVGITGTSATNSALTLANGTTYYVTVRATNGVGLSTDVTSDGVTVDNTPPVAGTVNDGVAADIDYQTSTDTINANWSGFSDPESGIAGYEWAIGTTSGGTDIQGFTSVGITGTSATNSTLSLTNGTTYYVTVRATNGAGLTNTATSDGVTVDSTPPVAGMVNDGLAADIDYQTSTDTINANWSGFSDPESGIAGYEWAIGTTSGGTDIQDFTSDGIIGTSATNSSLSLTNGTTYYVTIRATNGAGLSTGVTSDGVTVITVTSAITAGGCPFDKDGSDGQQFRLIFTPDITNLSSYKLNASNPGQFFYNIFYVGTPGETADISIVVPEPFVTQGAMPIHAYANVGFDGDCFIPEDEIGALAAQTDNDPDFDLSVEVPDSGLVYVRIHLDYGLKKTYGYTKDGSNNAIGAETISDLTEYDFMVTGDVEDLQTIQNVNVFKHDPGFAGIVTDSEDNPLGGLTVEIYNPDGSSLTSVDTDEDGFYFFYYKHKGKAADYTITLPASGESQSVSVKANGLVQVDFVVP